MFYILVAHIKTKDKKEIYAKLNTPVLAGRFAEVAPAKALRVTDNRSLAYYNNRQHSKLHMDNMAWVLTPKFQLSLTA